MNNSFTDWDEIQKRIESGKFKETDMTAEDWEIIQNTISAIYEVIYSVSSDTIRLFLNALPDDIGEADPDEQPLPEELPEASDGRNVPALYPLSKVLNMFYLSSEEQRATLEAPTTKDGGGGYVVVMDWDEIEKRLPEVKKLTPYDKRVHNAVCSFWAAGEPIASMQGLHYLSGGKGNIGKRDIQKLQKSLDRLSIRISMDYVASFKDRNGKIQDIQIVDRGAVINTRTITATVQGHKTKGAVKILEEPPLLKEAKRTKQITTVPKRVLQVPGNRTDESLIIHDKLVQYVVRLKHDGKLSEKIKLNTVCEWTGIDPNGKSQTARNAKSRIKSRVIKTLELFRQEDFIQDFSLNKGMIFIDAGRIKRIKNKSGKRVTKVRKMDYKSQENGLQVNSRKPL